MTTAHKAFEKLHLAAILTLGCIFPPPGACAESLSPEDLFSLEQEVGAITLSPDDDRAVILGIYDGQPVLILFNQLSGESRVIASLEKPGDFVPLFATSEILLMLGIDFRNSPAGILYPRYYSPLVLDLSDANVRPLFRSGNKLESWRGDRQPFLGYSDDGAQSYVWANRKERQISTARRRPVVAAVSAETKHPKIVSVINPSADLVFVGASGLPIASVDRHGSGYEERIWSHDDGTETIIYDVDSSASKVFVVGLTPKRDALVVQSESESGDWQCCYALNLSDGSVSGPLLQREGQSVDWLIVDPNGVVVGVQFTGFYPEYEFLDDKLTRRVQEIQALFPGSAVYLADLAPDRQTIVVYLTGVHSPGEFLKFSGESLESTLLARNTPEIMPNHLSPTHVIDFKGNDGETLQALLTIRDDVRKVGSAPLIVLPDSLSTHHLRVGFDPMVQYLAYRGYAVLQQQARRPKRDFTAEDLERYAGWLWQDLDSEIQSLTDSNIIDPERVCLIGDRYSAHTAFSASAFSSFQYNCVISIDGITDLSAKYVALKKPDRTVFGYFDRLIGRFGKGPQRLKELSPLQNIDSIDSAVLLITGDGSPSDSIEQSTRMYSRLIINGNDVHWLDVADEDGTWFKFDNRRQVLLAIGRFIESHLSPDEHARE